MNIAVGGPYKLQQACVGGILTRIVDTKRGNSFNTSYGRETLDVSDSSLDRAYQGSTSSTKDSPQQRADRIRGAEREILFGLTPPPETDDLDILLEPMTHLLIVSENQGDSIVDKWKELAEECGLKLTHHLILNEPEEPRQEENDGTVTLRAFNPAQGLKKDHRYVKPEGEIERLLAHQLIELAKNG